LLLQFEKRRGSLVSSLFKLQQQRKSKQINFVFIFGFGFYSSADATKETYF